MGVSLSPPNEALHKMLIGTGRTEVPVDIHSWHSNKGKWDSLECLGDLERASCRNSLRQTIIDPGMCVTSYCYQNVFILCILPSITTGNVGLN